MVSPSLVPAEPMRQVRDLARARFDLVEDRTRVKQRMTRFWAPAPFVSASAGHGTSESPNSLAATTWWTGSLCFARTVRGRSIRSHRDFSAGRVEMMNPA